jgi:hypothetical protein
VKAGEKVDEKGPNQNVMVTLGLVETAGNGGLMPDLRGKTKRQALAMLAPLGLRVSFRGQGLVKGQFPLPGVAVPTGAYCDLSCETQVSLPTINVKEGGT